MRLNILFESDDSSIISYLLPYYMMAMHELNGVYKKRAKMAKLKLALNSISDPSYHWHKALEDVGMISLRSTELTAKIPIGVLVACGVISQPDQIKIDVGFHDEDEFSDKGETEIKVRFGRRNVEFKYGGNRIGFPAAVTNHFMSLTNDFLDKLTNQIEGMSNETH